MIVMVEASSFTVERAKATLAAWDRYEPDVSQARIVEQANELAEVLRSLLGVGAASPESLGVNPEAKENDLPTTEGWRPIETAPRDGTEVLLLVDDVTHHGDWQGPSDGSIYSRSKSTTNWFSLSCGSSLYDTQVTHWMPLPASPLPLVVGGESSGSSSADVAAPVARGVLADPDGGASLDGGGSWA